ncbi:MAG TPA: nickel insertion protein, partial [Tepidiformaceae bacterium]|nr:nickel insertion protein [Tepidiformaceae bacterium]
MGSDGPRVAVFDCFSGIAGDMTVAALVSAGAPLAEISAPLRRLNIPAFELAAAAVRRGGIEATLLNVSISAEETYQPDEMRSKVRGAAFPARAEQRAIDAIDALEAGESEAHGTDRPHLHEAGGVDALIDICGSMLALEALD